MYANHAECACVDSFRALTNVAPHLGEVVVHALGELLHARWALF